jgi:hypothetical protein
VFRNLHLGGNILIGGVPDFLGSMSQLRVLELASNPLGGPLPPVLGRLKMLQRLDVKNASLVSTLPPELGSLSNLDYLVRLSINHLSGGLPASFAGMRKIREIRIADCNLTGDIPRGLFTSWPELISFQAQTNKLFDRNHSTRGRQGDEAANLVSLQQQPHRRDPAGARRVG